jgi:hypothetical protein
MRKRYGLIFLVTTAMTSSWHSAESRNVTNAAEVRDSWRPSIVDA